MTLLKQAENHSFNVSLAMQYGVEGAIVLGHIAFWIGVNQRKKAGFRDGKTWTYQTRKEMAAAMPYYSADQIRRITDKLCAEGGPLVKGNYNKSALDSTIWYAFADENQESLTAGESANAAGESAKYTYTDTKEVTSDVTRESTRTKELHCGNAHNSNEDDAYSITLIGKDGEYSYSKDDLHAMLARKNVQWSEEVIRYVWKSLAQYKGIVYDVWSFAEGTMKKHSSFLENTKKRKVQGTEKWKTKQSKQSASINPGSSESDSSEPPSQTSRCQTLSFVKSPNGEWELKPIGGIL